MCLAATSLLAGCPHPVRGPVEPDHLPPQAAAVCREPQALLEAGDFEQAVDALRVEATADPEFGADPTSDLCLGRALLGAGHADEARRLLEPLAGASGVPADVRRPACLYAAWSDGAAGDWASAGARLGQCDPDARLAPGDLLLGGDAPALPLVRAAGWAAAGRLPEAARVGQAFLEQHANDDASRRFLDRQLFTAAETADAAQVDALRAQGSPLAAALAAQAGLAEAARREAWDEVAAALPQAEPLLEAVRADDALQRARSWAARADSVRAPVFGAVLPLSGPARPAGRAALAGLLLAEGVFGDGDGTGSAPADASRLWVLDGGSTAGSAAEAVAELDARGVLGVIAPPDPTLAAAVEDEAEHRHLPVLILSDAVSPRPDGQWGFRFFANPDAEAAALADFLRAQGVFELAVAMPDPAPPYLERLVDTLQAEARARAIDVSPPLRYTLDDLEGQMDHAASVLAGEEFGALMIADNPDRATTLAAYLAVHDIWARPPERPPGGERREILYLGNSSWEDPAFLASGPDYLAGAVFPAWIPTEQGSPATARFVADFQAAFDRRPGVLEAYAYDALSLLRFLAVDSAARTRGSLRQALRDADMVGAATGAIHFDADRSSDTPPVLLEIRAGGFVAP